MAARNGAILRGSAHRDPRSGSRIDTGRAKAETSVACAGCRALLRVAVQFEQGRLGGLGDRVRVDGHPLIQVGAAAALAEAVDAERDGSASERAADERQRM